MDLCSYANGKELNVESIELIKEEFAHCKFILDAALLRACKDREKLSRMQIEIIKLNSIIDELRDENERLKLAAKGGEA